MKMRICSISAPMDIFKLKVAPDAHHLALDVLLRAVDALDLLECRTEGILHGPDSGL